MKTVGLIGGMSWESTVTYYRSINEAIKEALGGLHSAKILLYSVDFAELEACQASGDWDKSAAILSDTALALKAAGASFLVLCTNTMHKVAPEIERQSGLPLLHIAEATADALAQAAVQTAALLGTKYTMTQAFYKERLEHRGITVLIPEAADIELVNRIIFEELCLGILCEESRRQFVRIVCDLKARGAQGVILGCTEIGLLIEQADVPLPVFDTARIHARATAMHMLAP